MMINIFCICSIPIHKTLTNEVVYRIKGAPKKYKTRESPHLKGRIRYKECGERMVQDRNNHFLYICSNGHTRIWPPQEHEKLARQI